ncbi:hypothetical protein PCC21_034860 [Pectobacterium carotovorum subsp. carotovorum PCC21]|nr:hypothetical protein PCC21_034860 [Pectobacterium carotovorum subsp. carotovorum PCC21]
MPEKSELRTKMTGNAVFNINLFYYGLF